MPEAGVFHGGKPEVEVLHLGAQFLVPFRLPGLPVQGIDLASDLGDDVVHPELVLLGGFELGKRLLAPGLVLHDAGHFLEQEPAVLRLGGKDVVHFLLLDDGVDPGADAGIHHQVADVLQPAGDLVDQVFALAGTVEPAGDLDLLVMPEFG